MARSDSLPGVSGRAIAIISLPLRLAPTGAKRDRASFKLLPWSSSDPRPLALPTLAELALGPHAAFDVDVRQPGIDPGRKLPRQRAEQLEHRRQQYAADDQGIEEDRGREAETEFLHRPLVSEHERQKDADHDRRRGADDPAGNRHAVRGG